MIKGYVGFDTETTGISFTNSQVIEVGLVCADRNLNILDRLEIKVNYRPYTFEWSKEAEAVHNIPLSTALTHGIEAPLVFQTIKDFLKDMYGEKYNPSSIAIVGANSYFDLVMCENSLFAPFGHKLPFSHRVIDLQTLAYPLIGCRSLADICKYFNIKTDTAKLHSALYDAELHLKTYTELINILNKYKSIAL